MLDSLWERLLSYLSSLSQSEDSKNPYHSRDGYWVYEEPNS